MIITVKETKEDIINVMKLISKNALIRLIIIFILLIGYLLADIFVFHFLGVFKLLFIALIISYIIIFIKRNKNLKLQEERYLKIYGKQTERTFLFEDTEIIVSNSSNENKIKVSYDEIKTVKEYKEYIVIIDKYKYINYMKKSELTEQLKKDIYNLLNSKNVKVK